MAHRLKQALPLILVLLLAATLRVAALLKYGDFWNDELFSVVYSQKPWGDSITKYWVWETNPPLHMIILKFWFYLFPVNEITARLPSLLSGLASIIALYVFIKRVFTKRVALISALILSLSPLHIFHSLTARAYMPLILFAILSADYFSKIFLEKTASKKQIWIYGLLNILLLYSHFTALGVLAAQLTALVICQKKSAARWVRLNFFPVVLWLGWAIPSLAYKLNGSIMGRAWYFNIDHSLENIFAMSQLLITGPTSWLYGLFVGAALTAACGWAVYKTHQNKNLSVHLLFIFVMAALPLSAALVFGFLNPRFFIVSLPWISVLAAWVISILLKKFWHQLLCLVVLLPGLYAISTLLPITDWSPALLYLQKGLNENKKQLLIYNELSYKNQIDYYFPEQLSSRPIALQKYADWDYYYILHNYLDHYFNEKNVTQWIKENRVDRNEELFVLQNNALSTDIVRILENSGWKLKTKMQIKTERYIDFAHLVKT